MIENIENSQEIDKDIKRLLDNIENIKSTVDLYSVLVDEKVTLPRV